MARVDMYCPNCECIRYEEPCVDCIESSCQCKGECVCCAEYRINNTMMVFSERKEPIGNVHGDGNNDLEVKLQHLEIEEKRAYHFLGPPACFSDLKTEFKAVKCTDKQTESLANVPVKQTKSETQDSKSESRLSGQFDTSSEDGNEPPVCSNSNENSHESEYWYRYGYLNASRRPQMVSMARRPLKPEESTVQEKEPTKPNQCDGCTCLPGHVSCKNCIVWDLSCTYPIDAIRCTCCDKFENSLDPSSPP